MPVKAFRGKPYTYALGTLACPYSTMLDALALLQPALGHMVNQFLVAHESMVPIQCSHQCPDECLQLLSSIYVPNSMSAIHASNQSHKPSGMDLREDASHLVVLDGLVSRRQRSELLEWLTAAQHDHSGDPPPDKWERGCVDRAGDKPTWGLQQQVRLT